MSFWFKAYREHSDDPQNSMLAEIYRLVLQTRSEVTSQDTTASDLEKKRVDIIPSESYIIIITGNCFVKGERRDVNSHYIHYAGREPDGLVCRCWVDFNYRANILADKSLVGNDILLRGLPKIISYQPEAPPSSLKLNGVDAYADMGITPNLKIGEAGGSEITVAFWLYVPSTPASDSYIVSRGSPNSYAAYVAAGGNIKVQFFYGDSTNAILDSGISAVGAFHRVMVSHSDVNDISKIFVDGELKASNVKNHRLITSGNTSTSRFMIGAKATGASTQSNFLDGNVDDVSIWKRQLTDDEAMDDFLGETVSTTDLVSEWTFDEDESSTKSLDSQSYNTATLVNAVYDKEQIPELLQTPYPYKDGVVNELLGYKTSGEQYLIIPELSNDFRITDKSSGGCCYTWLIKLSTYDTINNNYMRLLQKADDFTASNIQSIQIREDGKLYVLGKFGGSEKKVRTVDPLRLDKLYLVGVGIDYTAIAGGTGLDIFNISLNGLFVAIETTTEDAEFPAAEDIVDFHTYLLAGNEQLRGNLVGQIYSFRYYNEDMTAANMLGLQTNKFTTRQIDRGHVARSNLTKMYETNKNREVALEPETGVTDLFEYFLSDTEPTARFTNEEDVVDISDDFDFVLTTPVTHYSLELNGTTAFVEIPTLDPVRRHFSISCWVRYEGNTGGWGGIISRIDGMPNGNRLMLTDTKIRWHTKYGEANDPFRDYVATVSSMTGSFHHIGITYDGDDDEEIKIWKDGHIVLRAHQEGQIKGGDDADNGKTYIGKGADNNYFLDGKIDELIIYDRTLSDSEMRKLSIKGKVSAGIMAHYSFEKHVRDIQDGEFNGTLRGGAKFSSTVP